jgi:hypothetical protein
MVTFTRTYSNAPSSTKAGETGTGIITFEKRLFQGLATIEHLGVAVIGFDSGTFTDSIFSVSRYGLAGISTNGTIQIVSNPLKTTNYYTVGSDSKLFKYVSGTAYFLQFKTSPQDTAQATTLTGGQYPRIDEWKITAGRLKPITHRITKRYTTKTADQLTLEPAYIPTPFPTSVTNPFSSNANVFIDDDAASLLAKAQSGQWIRAEPDTLAEYQGGLREITTVEVKASDAIGLT